MLPKEQQKDTEGNTDAIEEEGTPGEASMSATTEELLGLGAPISWRAVSSSLYPSSQLTYWKLDEHPTPQDGQRRALDWVGTARAVAGRVSKEEVDRMMNE